VASSGKPSNESCSDLGRAIPATGSGVQPVVDQKQRAVWLFGPREGSSKRLRPCLGLETSPLTHLPTSRLRAPAPFFSSCLQSSPVPRVQFPVQVFHRTFNFTLGDLDTLHLILAKRPRSDAFAVCHTYFYGTLVLRKGSEKELACERL
jgi:hypothetical protein